MTERHVKTDPACTQYRQPRTPLGWWWFDRHRGVGCARCMREYRAAGPCRDIDPDEGECILPAGHVGPHWWSMFGADAFWPLP